jgi:hypothetical protein
VASRAYSLLVHRLCLHDLGQPVEGHHLLLLVACEAEDKVQLLPQRGIAGGTTRVSSAPFDEASGVKHVPAASHEEGRRTQADRAVLHRVHCRSAGSPLGFAFSGIRPSLVEPEIRIQAHILQSLRNLLALAIAVGTEKTEADEEYRGRTCTDPDGKHGV